MISHIMRKRKQIGVGVRMNKPELASAFLLNNSRHLLRGAANCFWEIGGVLREGGGVCVEEFLQNPSICLCDIGDRGEEILGVGVLRIGEEGFGIAAFHDFTCIHHNQTITDGAHYGEVMRDE